MASNRTIPTIVIAGPTASGKSALALDIAQKISGEIVCADSRTVYKELSIGVAKPTPKEQKIIKHHCLDLVSLDQDFSVADFKKATTEAVADIKSRGNIPVIVGGSGLYIDAYVYDFSFKTKPDEKIRSKLNNMTIEDLQQIIINKKLTMPTNMNNKRHLIRVIESNGEKPLKKQKPNDVIYTGLNIDNDQLFNSISNRVNKMYESGFLDEVESLGKSFNEQLVRSAGIGYSSALDYLQGRISADLAKQEFIKGDKALARRQKTWLKRNADILWFDTPSVLKTHIFTSLNK